MLDTFVKKEVQQPPQKVTWVWKVQKQVEEIDEDGFSVIKTILVDEEYEDEIQSPPKP